MIATTIVFWFEFASTYSYPAAMRVDDVARQYGAAVVWRPFLLGPIFRNQGWPDSPFNIYPVKGRYMWRDLERTCAGLRIPFQRPSQFQVVARVAVSGGASGAGSCAGCTRHAETSMSPMRCAAQCLNGLVVDRRRRSRTQAAVRSLTGQNTDRAVHRHFKVPTFVVGDEPFKTIAWRRWNGADPALIRVAGDDARSSV
jgi:2-hydroxychromene-2-carboxylate isomerase